MQYLIDRLNNEPGLEKVWFDENGGWSLNPSNRHPIERTKDEVLDHWNGLSDREKIETYGLDSGLVQQEHDPSEQVKLLEEENDLLNKQMTSLTEELDTVKSAQAEEHKEVERLTAELDAANKTIAALNKKLKKEEKSE